MYKSLKNGWLLTVMAIFMVATSCEDDDEPVAAVVASFQFTQDEADFRKIAFKNFSQNFQSLSWNFGDGSAAVTEEDPIHTYEVEGSYTVTLTATGADGSTDTHTAEVEVADPNNIAARLTGDGSKSWKLLRDVSTEVYPLEVGPITRAEIWWALGRNEEIGVRPCMLNDEYIFSTDGTYEYKTNGDYWAEAGVWEGTPGCRDTETGGFVNVDGADISAWGDGTHQFEYNVEANELTVSGEGAFIGLTKLGSTAEVKVPQTSVTYEVVSLVDAEVDTLVLETTIPDGYWRVVLVHYDDPSQEPEIPGAKPTVGFTYEINGPEVTFTNNSSGTGTITYSWDFGDGATSTETSPVHTYDGDGVYEVVLSATNENGTSTSTQQVTISSSVLTADALNGGGEKQWVIKPAAGSFKVGPSKGSGEWFDAGNIAETRACLANDLFIFKTGNVYEYDAQGDIWGEGYMGVTDGCIDESALPANAAAWGSDEHTYTFTPATDTEPATITVTGTGAFIALPKAYNGGEYAAAPPTENASVEYEVLSYVNDGSVETLTIAIDVSADQAGTAYWTFVLISE